MMKLVAILLLLLLETCAQPQRQPQPQPLYENVALRGKATQSDRFEHAFGGAYSAIDGNRNSRFSAGSCTHTDEEANPWWRVDLLESYVISSVTITNRGDCCPERLNGVQIHIGNSLDANGASNPMVGTISSIPSGQSFTLFFTPVEGRYVNVILPGPKRILTLCEVEVYGYRVSEKSQQTKEVAAV